jgi:tRNA-dihydrouridine synthase C
MPRILPGPLEGVMGADMCRVMTEFDLVPMWITPFIRVSANVPGIKRLEAHLAPFAQRPTIVQLMGTRSDLIAQTARRVASLPFVRGVELNCACPSNTVMNKGSGAALLARPEWIPQTIEAIRQSVPGINVGVKVRSGVTSSDEIGRIMQSVASAEPDWCVMHYRTAEEFYRPVANGWDRFDVAREVIPQIPLFASGDLFTVEDCLALGSEHPVDGMTPARGLMRNPWLLRDLEARIAGNPPVVGNVTRVLIRLAELGLDHPKWRVGRLLEIAGMAWGRESERFKALVGSKDARAMIERLRALS